MPRRKGDLPGRLVNAHIRKWPNRPSEYLNVAAYQEREQPPPSELQIVPPQLELDLQETSLPKRIPAQIAANSRSKLGRSRMRMAWFCNHYTCDRCGHRTGGCATLRGTSNADVER